ncbi:MAG: hypothetical protein ACLRYY_08985 [Anaerobutyricum soehngenii]
MRITHLLRPRWRQRHADRTSCCLLVDKEEIGSVGATGMQSMFFENTVAEILALMGQDSNSGSKKSPGPFQDAFFRCKRCLRPCSVQKHLGRMSNRAYFWKRNGS